LGCIIFQLPKIRIFTSFNNNKFKFTSIQTGRSNIRQNGLTLVLCQVDRTAVNGSTHRFTHQGDMSLSKLIGENVTRPKETRRRGCGPMSLQEVEAKKQKDQEDMIKGYKVTAVMAVYNKFTTVQAAAMQSDLSEAFINDLIARAKALNLKEEANKFMQVTRYVHTWFDVNNKRRMYTDHEYREGLFAFLAGDMDHKQVLTEYGVEERTLSGGKKRLGEAHGIQLTRKKVRWSGWSTRQALREAIDAMDTASAHSGPKSALQPAEAALILHRWDLLAEMGKGLASRGQISDLQSIADNLATNLTQEIEEDARAGRVDTQKIKTAEAVRSVHG
jgi:hypothetical protein